MTDVRAGLFAAYLFAIPDAWADAHVGGRWLATGRYRDGGWSGMGPSLIAYARRDPEPGRRQDRRQW